MFRRVAVVLALTTLCALGGAGIAQAQTGLTCVFDGLSGQLTPGIPNIVADAGLDVERGAYNFSSTGGPFSTVCGGIVFGVPVAAVNASITSSGFYDNILCGQKGFAHDLDGNSTTITLAGFAQLTNIGYDIQFKGGGHGDLQIGPDGAASRAGASELLPADPAAPTHPADGVGGGMHGAIDSSYTGEGEVRITPVAPGNCVTTSVSAFEVSGSFTLTGTG